jgi:hypothetical protein
MEGATNREELLDSLRTLFNDTRKHLPAEMLLNLFWCSLTSYKKSSICSPFPSFMKTGNICNYREAVSVPVCM